MSSGYFPLSTSYGHGEILKDCAKKIKRVCSEQTDAASQDCTPEDALSDGAFLEKLSMAVELIEACLDKPMPMTFEQYLVDAHAKQYTGLDDEMPDDYSDWLSKLDVQEIIDFAQKWKDSLK